MTNRTIKRTLGLLGVLLASGALTSAQEAISTNLVSETTFDPAAPAPWGFTYFYSDSGLGYAYYDREYYLPEDFELTNGMWHFVFDLTSLVGITGYGAGTGGPLFLNDPAGFISTNRSDYVFSWDARVEGLDVGQTSANAEMQVQFFYMVEGTATKSLQINLPFQPTSEWQRFSFNLGDGGFGDNTSAAGFAEHGLDTTEVRFAVNFHEPHNAFGYDGWEPGTENTLFIDNTRLEVLEREEETPLPVVPVTMAEWNFDDKLADFEYHYQWSANEVQPVTTAGNNAGGASPNTLGTDGSSAWFVTLDNSGFMFNPPAWAGGGSGGAGSVDFSLFDTPDLDGYRVTFDARVEGLALDRTATTAVLQIFTDVPDDTIQPADENTDTDALVRLDFPISQVGTEWKTYTFTFRDGSFGAGTRANFEAFHNLINGLRTQWQIENIGSVADWDYDANNTLIIDNFKLERLVAGLGEITIVSNAGQPELTWTAPAESTVRLQEASSVEGPFTDVEGAASPYPVSTDGTARFFRLIQGTEQP